MESVEAGETVDGAAAEMRARKDWFLAGGREIRYSRPLVMGIVNVTPDSFYDGGATIFPNRPLPVHLNWLIKARISSTSGLNRPGLELALSARRRNSLG